MKLLKTEEHMIVTGGYYSFCDMWNENNYILAPTSRFLIQAGTFTSLAGFTTYHFYHNELAGQALKYIGLPLFSFGIASAYITFSACKLETEEN